MPEGDTIARAAARLRECLLDREVTAARTTAPVPVATLVGDRVAAVEANGKHLMIRFASGRVLHTHMRMTGHWRVYTAPGRWGGARLVLEAGERAAVCFNAPVIELLRPGGEAAHPALTALGPDVLADPLDVAGVVARASVVEEGTEIGDLLLDQRVVAGIGNIWRNEALFVTGTHPRRPAAACDVAKIVGAAATMMRASAAGRRVAHWVYRQGGRPCRRCGTPIASAAVGAQGRRAYWCPRCQPEA
ncbi:MAG TPA: DNA-formamidopyrimidine glycosylase family protein [Acidimicrobiales bacterium]|nr:DNA-formamidopyrimidine glycosylase family protein [Acidimicrobiales bacterium]